ASVVQRIVLNSDWHEFQKSFDRSASHAVPQIGCKHSVSGSPASPNGSKVVYRERPTTNVCSCGKAGHRPSANPSGNPYPASAWRTEGIGDQQAVGQVATRLTNQNPRGPVVPMSSIC